MNWKSVRIGVIFIWVGFVCAISFMEAWLKFTAPGVSLTTGLSIGRVVFSALNKVELVLCSVIVLSYLPMQPLDFVKEWVLTLVIIVLVFQTVYLLPQLSARIDLWLSGAPLANSNLHTTYVGLEVTKVLLLLRLGFKQFII